MNAIFPLSRGERVQRQAMALLTLIGGVVLCASAWLFLRAGVGGSFVQAPLLANALDALPMAAGFGLMLAGTARPVLSGVVLGATALGLRLTDEVKREVLHEPVNFSDRAELPEVVRHPQLYLPFAGTGLVLAAAALLLLAAGALTWAEPPLWRRSWPAAAAALLLAAIAARAGFVLPALRPAVHRLAAVYGRLRPSRDPEQDARRLGPLASLVVHATLAAAERPSRVAAAKARPAPLWPASAGPVVLVQASTRSTGAESSAASNQAATASESVTSTACACTAAPRSRHRAATPSSRVMSRPASHSVAPGAA